jgi:hypothetical protein
MTQYNQKLLRYVLNMFLQALALEVVTQIVT